MLELSDMRATGRRFRLKLVPWWTGGPLAAAAVCALGLGLGLNATAAVAAFVLAVVAAVLVWGQRSGLLCAAVSFVGLNFFFTHPVGTFAVGKTDDLLALGVFFVVSLVVGRLFSDLVAERLRAERRERESGYLYEVAQALVTGSTLRETLALVARSLVEAFRLSRVEIRLEPGDDTAPERSIVVAAAGHTDAVGPPTTLGLGSGGGVVVLYPRGPEALDEETLGLAGAFVSQASVAVERARLDRAAREARLESEASEMRAALFSAVTHDLKTPLSSVKAAVTSLLDSDARLGPADTRILLETILAEADRLGRLIGNVLDLARIEARALEPHAERADVAELVGAVLHRLRPTLDGRAIEVAIRDDLPEVAVDVVQIDQVLSNLVENAHRFSPPDAPIRIAASRWHAAVEVRVADGGPGIPAAERERVFESFYRTDRGAGRGGSGLGLAIARAIVAAHRGKMRIEDTPGGGTTVVFSLPLAEQP